MTFEVFRPHAFKADKLRTIEAANAIIEEYQDQGLR
jgi:hypothetical protein